MRTFLILLGAFLASAAVHAQPRGLPAWYQITSRSGTEVIQARLLETQTSRSGQTRVTADGQRIRTDGPVLIIPMGTADQQPQPQSTPGVSGGVSPGVTFRPSKTYFRTFSFSVKVEGKSVVRMTDMTNRTQTTTTTTTRDDGSTTTETTTEEAEADPGGGEEGETD